MDDALISRSRRFGLRVRLISLIGLALLPVFALAALQTITDARESQVQRRADLTATVRLFAHDQAMQIGGIRDVMETLRAIPAVTADDAICDYFLANLSEPLGEYTTVALVGGDGAVGCAFPEPMEGQDFSGTDWFEDIRNGDAFSIGRATFSEITSGQVLVLAMPIDPLDPEQGAIATAIRISFLEQLGIEAQNELGRIAGIVDRTGRVITQRANLDVENVDHAHLAEASRSDVVVYDVVSTTGEDRTYALAQVADQDIFVLLAEPIMPLLSWHNIDIVASILIPLVMWALSLTVIWIASDYLILRWLQYLRRFARLYGLGRYELIPEKADKAPQEIRELANSMNWMAKRVSERDEELQDSLDQKKMLIREVHHRVKNNLQIITSLINLQLSRSTDEASSRSLKEAQARINALALIHRNLYEAENLTRISIGPFIQELSRLNHTASTGGGFDVDLEFVSDVEDEVLTTDQAVPLSMFITEAMTNAYKHAFSKDGRDQRLTICLSRQTDDEGVQSMRVEVSDNGPGFADDQDYKGVGSSLFDAFAIQLEGKCDIGNRKAGGAFVRITFPLG